MLLYNNVIKKIHKYKKKLQAYHIKYCEIIFICGGVCSWVAKIVLVPGDIISLIASSILYINTGTKQI